MIKLYNYEDYTFYIDNIDDNTISISAYNIKKNKYYTCYKHDYNSYLPSFDMFSRILNYALTKQEDKNCYIIINENIDNLYCTIIYQTEFVTLDDVFTLYLTNKNINLLKQNEQTEQNDEIDKIDRLDELDELDEYKDKLIKANKELDEQIDDIKLINIQLKERYTQLEEYKDKLIKANKELEKTNKELDEQIDDIKLINIQLKERYTQLEDVIIDLKVNNKEFDIKTSQILQYNNQLDEETNQIIKVDKQKFMYEVLSLGKPCELTNMKLHKYITRHINNIVNDTKEFIVDFTSEEFDKTIVEYMITNKGKTFIKIDCCTYPNKYYYKDYKIININNELIQLIKNSIDVFIRT